MNFIKLDINEKDIKNAIKKALSQNFNKRDNLRNRHTNVQFDCLLRGYIGEIGIKKWFEQYGIKFEKTNFIEDSTGNIDIDLLYQYSNNKHKSIEIKTSLIPDNIARNKKENIDSKILKCLENYDIKLIRRNKENIENLKSDIHIQVYFGDLRKAKDTFLENSLLSFNIDNKSIDESLSSLIECIYNTIHSKTYIDRTYFLSWIDKETLVNQINSKSNNEKTWSFNGSKRDFWTCKMLNEGKMPIDLIKYIKNLDGEIINENNE